MRTIKEVLRLKHSAQLSHRQIAGSLKISTGVVTKYLAAAERAQLRWPLPSDMDDLALSHALWPQNAPPSIKRLAALDFADIHLQLKHKGVTRQLLWEEYAASHPEGYGYTQFCVLYRDWRSRLKLSMRQTHRAGEKLFVDYCGPTIPIVNLATGEVKEAQVFVAVLGASNYTYAEATATQSLPDWIGSHTRAFAFFGGVPQLVVPDNLKSGVTRACRYEPLLNTSYAEMLAHYQTAALPARPYKPRDKAKVEVGVQVVERWVLARLRHHTFFSLLDLNLMIRSLLSDLNTRPFKKLPGTRHSQFEALDRPALLALPAQPYEYAEWRRARVNLDYHVEVDGHYYSVPHSLVKREIEVRLTNSGVEFFHGSKRVAVHARSNLRGAHSTQPDHMPRSHRAHLEWTPGRFLNWATEIGPNTRDLIRHLLETKSHPEQGYRSCLGLLGLSRQYGQERLELACQRALALAAPTRRSVLSILRRGLDQVPLPTEERTQTIHSHENVRGSAYYQ
jgi:transposase